MKIFFFVTLSKKLFGVLSPTFLGELDQDELEYAVFFPNLLNTFILILTSL